MNFMIEEEKTIQHSTAMYEQLNTTCAIIVVVTSIVGMYSNTSIVHTFYRMSKKARSKTSNTLLVNQAIADISTVVPQLLDSVFIYYLIVQNVMIDELNF